MVEGEKSQVGIIESDYETWADVHSYHGKLYCVYTQTIAWKQTTFQMSGYDLCDAQIVECEDELLAIIREKGVSGWDLFLARSLDRGLQWGPLERVAFKGGGKPSAVSLGEKLYLAFARDQYKGNKKTLQVISTDLKQFAFHSRTAQFYVLADKAEYSIFEGSNLGYTGITSNEEQLIAVNVRKSKNHKNTVIETVSLPQKMLDKKMIPYKIIPRSKS